MERSPALSAAGALTLTAAAAVSALFLTVDRGAADAAEPTTPAVAESEVVTQYEVVTVDGTESEIVEPGAAESATDAAYADADHMDGEEDEEHEGEGHEEDEHPEGEEYPEDDEYPEDEMEDEDEMEEDDDDD